MTRRQIYFYSPERGTYYVSEEINGDKEELERMGSSDSCEKSWPEILDGLKDVFSLDGFLRALAAINGLYHSFLAMELPATKLRVVRSYAEIGVKDQTYGIIDGMPGAFLDDELSIWKEDGTNRLGVRMGSRKKFLAQSEKDLGEKVDVIG